MTSLPLLIQITQIEETKKVRNKTNSHLLHLQISDNLPDIRQPTPERSAIEQLFNDIAGPGGEIGWAELKRILDHSMRDGELRASL